MSSLITRIFKNGNSQAVRIPQEFRLDTTQVEISRNANGDLEQNYREQPAMQDRETL